MSRLKGQRYDHWKRDRRNGLNMEWEDGKVRCGWANPKNEAYLRYHDEEWGVPVHDDRKLLEMLVLTDRHLPIGG